MKKFTAYKISSEQTGKAYVGMTSQKLKRRIYAHVRNASHGVEHPLYDDIRLVGWGAFIVTELASCKTYEAAQDLERLLIASHNSLYPEGYNLETGGNLGKRATTYVKERLSTAHIGIPQSPEALAKRAISMAAAYDRDSGTLRNTRSAQFKGVAKTSEHKFKIGTGNSGKIRTSGLKNHLAKKTSEFAETRRQWAAQNSYSGPLNSITRKMLEGAK
jgi:group I intron endonuclease